VRLFEEIYDSQNAIVYHRYGNERVHVEGKSYSKTRVHSDPAMIPSVLKNREWEFRKNAGSAYGPGVYTVYEIESTLRRAKNPFSYTQVMSTPESVYGPYIMKCRAHDVDQMLVFDYNELIKIDPHYNKSDFFEEQLERFCLDPVEEVDSARLRRLKYTSKCAIRFYHHSLHNKIPKELKGLIFTGETDGRVAIFYDQHSLDPLSYSVDKGKTWIEV
jgi:hypothetical protein